MKVLHDAIFIPFQLMDAGQSPKTEKVSKLFPLREICLVLILCCECQIFFKIQRIDLYLHIPPSQQRGEFPGEELCV